MFRQKLQQFMMGRYGVDQLSIFLTVTALISSLISSILNLKILSFLASFCLVYSVFRMYSRNISARYQENQKFLPYWNKLSRYAFGIKTWILQLKSKWRDRKNHRYFTCPTCKQTLRVPKGKGKIKISCPKCRTELIRKT